MVSAGFVSAIVFMVIVLGFMVFTVAFLHGDETHESYSYNGTRGLTGEGMFRRWTIAICTFLLLAFALGLYPYEREHHWYLEHTGVIVAKDASTFNVNEDQKYRIELDDGTVFRSDDFRFVPLQVGDTVTVHCIKSWIYNAQDRNECTFGSAP